MMDISATDLIYLQNIPCTYYSDKTAHPVLHNISFSIIQGQSCAIMDTSGPGKYRIISQKAARKMTPKKLIWVGLTNRLHYRPAIIQMSKLP